MIVKLFVVLLAIPYGGCGSDPLDQQLQVKLSDVDGFIVFSDLTVWELGESATAAERDEVRSWSPGDAVISQQTDAIHGETVVWATGSNSTPVKLMRFGQAQEDSIIALGKGGGISLAQGGDLLTFQVPVNWLPGDAVLTVRKQLNESHSITWIIHADYGDSIHSVTF